MELTSNFKRTLLGLAAITLIGVLIITQGVAHASNGDKSSQTLASVQSKGNAAIGQRLTTLNNLATKVNSSTTLSASDKSYLSNEISTEIAGLTALKSTLAADTTVTEANTDYGNIFSDYRVYALVAPKVAVVSTVDVLQSKLNTLNTTAQTLQTTITAKQAAGKDVTNAQAALNTMTSAIASAQSQLTSIDSKVLPLQPSDWNANHQLLSGYKAQLNTLTNNLKTISSEAKSTASSIKDLKS